MTEYGREVDPVAYASIVALWREQNIQTRDAPAQALDGYRVRFSYHSGRIENANITYYDTRSVFEDGRIVGYTGDVRTLFEMQNLKECHELMLDAFSRRALMNYLLLLYEHPPIIIYNEDKLAYYGAIELWETEGELEPMRAFLAAETVKTWKRM